MSQASRLWVAGGVKIKICAIRSIDIALELSDIGIDAIGLHVFGDNFRTHLTLAKNITKWVTNESWQDPKLTPVVLTDRVEYDEILV